MVAVKMAHTSAVFLASTYPCQGQAKIKPSEPAINGKRDLSMRLGHTFILGTCHDLTGTLMDATLKPQVA